MGKWISIKDKLPEEYATHTQSDEVFVLLRSQDGTESIQIDRLVDGKWEQNSNTDKSFGKFVVVSWCPMKEN